MPFAQAAYLTLVVCGFALFMIVLGSISLSVTPPWGTSRPAARQAPKAKAAPESRTDQHAA